jgi:hypothetical protein
LQNEIAHAKQHDAKHNERHIVEYDDGIRRKHVAESYKKYNAIV